jgi:hypothetical protein
VWSGRLKVCTASSRCTCFVAAPVAPKLTGWTVRYRNGLPSGRGLPYENTQEFLLWTVACAVCGGCDRRCALASSSVRLPEFHRERCEHFGDPPSLRVVPPLDLCGELAILDCLHIPAGARRPPGAGENDNTNRRVGCRFGHRVMSPATTWMLTLLARSGRSSLTVAKSSVVTVRVW